MNGNEKREMKGIRKGKMRRVGVVEMRGNVGRGNKGK